MKRAAKVPPVRPAGPRLTGLLLATARRIDYPGWRGEVRAALLEHRSIPLAAIALGITRRTLDQWLRKEPSLRAGVDLAGPGRPVG